MTGKTILAIDQGTTLSQVMSLDAHGCAREVARAEFAQHYLQQDWVEHDVEGSGRDAPATSAPTDEGER